MLTQIQGLHHVTSLATSARKNNAFFTRVLGLRRVKQTVNFDNPKVYHLYYGDAQGTPGTVMTYFPFPDAKPRQKGAGEVSRTAFAIPKGSAAFWGDRLAAQHVDGIAKDQRFGEDRVLFTGPDGDDFALVETDDPRTPWQHEGVPLQYAIRGFHSVEMMVQDVSATGELLMFMGYEEKENAGSATRFHLPLGSHATTIDVVEAPKTPDHRQGAGSVHHIAFAVKDREAQLEARRTLSEAGYAVTPVKDRDYFLAIYFRSPGGVLFEIATNEPGFTRDESAEHLGETLQLPRQHAHLRTKLAETLEPLGD